MFEPIVKQRLIATKTPRAPRKTIPKCFDFLGVLGALGANALVSKPFCGYRTVEE